MAGDFSRRDVVARALPAAALLTLGGAAAFGQANDNDAKEGRPPLPALFKALQSGFKDGKYVLPPLPYGYDALEPHIDAQTMQLHHDKHHQGYVDGLNKTLAALGEKEAEGALLYGLERDLSFNGGGHLMHTLFWATMKPNGGGDPTGELADGLKNDFGSVDKFKSHFSKVAASVKGSGWALLGYESMGRKLIVYSVNEHDTHVMPGVLPLLPLDVWEHAFYLKYQNKKADYVKAWWNLVNWEPVNELYAFMHAK